MRIGRGEKLGLVFVAASFVLAATLYSRLPDPVQTHWTALDQPDGWTPKPWGAFIQPLALVAVWLAAFALARGFRGQLEKSRGPFEMILAVIVGFVFVVTSAGQLFTLDRRIPLLRIIVGAGGVLLMVLGNFMGKLRRNRVIGIRTPWTLASDEVWVRTHQFGGKVMVAGGAVIAISAASGFWKVPSLIAILAVAGGTILYSYVVSRRMKSESYPGG
jgi:uncharacterized membrane protein